MRKKHKPMSKGEILKQAMLLPTRKYTTVEELTNYVRAEKEDKNIILGKKVGFGLALIELMLYWEVTDDDLKGFIEKHNEFLTLYDSTDKDDKAEVLDLFKQLQERTGYSIITEETE